MSEVFQYSSDQLKQIRDNFVEELKNASLGKKTSLAFIKNPLPQKPLVKDGEIFQVMVVGGAVFETALVKKEGNSLLILKQQKETLPLFKNKQTFLTFVEKNLYPKISVVALNFAYALKPVIRGRVIDGIKLGTGGKGHKFTGLINKKVGEEIEKYIFSKRQRKIKVVVANDTICLLLSNPIMKPTIVAGIVGAGTNFAFFLDENSAINLESGNFDKFPQTATGKIVDQNSTQPGKQLFEKEVSGAYLYQHYNVLKHRSELSSTLELNNYAEKGDIFAQKLIERSASLIACQIAGLYQFKSRNLKFIMEGSLFWHGWHYRDFVEKYLAQLGVAKKYFKFIKIKDSGIIGASRLVTG